MLKAIFKLLFVAAIGVVGWRYYLEKTIVTQKATVTKKVNLTSSGKLYKTYTASLPYSYKKNEKRAVISSLKKKAEAKAIKLIEASTKKDRTYAFIYPSKITQKTETIVNCNVEKIENSLKNLRSDYFSNLARAREELTVLRKAIGFSSSSKAPLMKAKSLIDKALSKKIYIPYKYYKDLDSCLDKLKKSYEEAAADKDNKFQKTYAQFIRWVSAEYKNSESWKSYLR